ncbi:MAG: ATP-binding protein, partial [Gemmatimonadota bacterium]
SRKVPSPDGQTHLLVGTFEDVSERRRREVRQQAVARVREQVWRMQDEGEIRNVLSAVRRALEEMEIPFLDCGINVVEEDGDPPRVRLHVLTSRDEWVVSVNEIGSRTIAGFWRGGEAVYRADLRAEDRYGERDLVQRLLGTPVLAVLDVPFSHGTLAMNSAQAQAFSAEDIAVAQELAAVLSEGFRRAEDLRRVSAERERLLVTLRSIGDGVITTDRQGRVLLVNQVTEALTGWTQEEARGRPLAEVFRIANEHTREVCPNPVEKVLAHGRVEGLANHTLLVARDGTERMIADCGAPIPDRSGEIIGVVLVFRDITAQRRHEEEMGRAEKLDSLGVLAGGIAHDFNNLLTAIIGNVSLARLDVPEEEPLHETLSLVEEASQQAAALTQQLLTFSKGGAPVKRLAPLDELVRDSATFALRGSKARCDFGIEADLWPAEVDPGQMSQVVHSLVTNASQAMPEGGVIRVRAGNCRLAAGEVPPLEAGPHLRLEVEDEGTGIPPGHLQRIFEPYFSTKQRGSGLGLATVHSIIAHHDGHVSVRSSLGVGTTFTVWIPAAEEAGPAAARSGEPVPHGTGRILVMDDDPAVRRLAGDMLRRLGYEVVTAADGAEALTRYREAAHGGGPFQAVLLDLTIPGGMGGRETMARLREMDPGVRAIVSSGYSNDPTMANARSFGFSGVVAKPYNVADLATIVHRVLAEDQASP